MIARGWTAHTFLIGLAGTALGASACAWPGSIQYTTPIRARPHSPPLDLSNAPLDADAAQPGVVRKVSRRAEVPADNPPTPSFAWPRGLVGAAARPAPRPSGAPQAQSSPDETGDIPALNISQITFAAEGADFDPCVTPDGTRIVYASTQHRATADIYLKPIDGRVVTQLTSDPADDLMPAVSPEGGRIAFASNRSGNWDIYMMPIGGGRAVQVTNDPADEIHPSWSPDGAGLVFCRMGESSGRWEMWVTDAANQATCSFIGFGMFPQWCPVPGSGADGADRILFQLTRERGQRAFGLWTIDYKNGTTSNATEIVGSSRAAFINPTWSPDGRRIVYTAVPNPSDWGEIGRARPTSAELWMINIDGTGRVNLTSASTVSLMPSWGPGDRLYFVASRGGPDNIWSIDVGAAIMAAGGADHRAGQPPQAANKPQAPEAPVNSEASVDTQEERDH